ncbi:TolC family outer membrane protein [Alsobacter sp. SYSU M60028]|uniref:TolC family outer membrane protein n=1 Tax=Alsobacter ponti TaxID=2962936 RepID=A0ABT1LC00_9HYPH|nr:TolC family outer membrane protein [Alsobacter ponti]MCP8938578.1 TolC family outer membrane protein [Alsobacter ponti]
MNFQSVYRAALLASAVTFVAAGAASAETMEGALARAYSSNPTLNASRAGTRATDETVPQALSGYRPRIAASADAGFAAQTTDASPAGYANDKYFPRGLGVQIDQNLWNGNRTGNSVRRADSTVLQAREELRRSEQLVLLDASTAYMDVLRDTAILDLRNNNIEVLDEQLRQTKDRFNVGEVTRTDVAQAEARLASSRADASLAAGNLKSSLARYRQVVGADAKQLSPAKAIDALLPRTLDEAVAASQAEHPQVLSALHAVDAAQLTVKVIEGELYPTVGVRGSVTQRWDFQSSNRDQLASTLVGTVAIPIYEGGETYARVRQAKETLGQRRLDADTARELVRANVVSAWGQLEATKERITAGQASIVASETALNGVREEAKVGQRTTLDVLNAQQELLSSRVALIQAQRDRVVASYAVLSAVGRLSAQKLRLAVTEYRPSVHYEQVRDKWIGLRTPDGK